MDKPADLRPRTHRTLSATVLAVPVVAVVVAIPVMATLACLVLAGFSLMQWFAWADAGWGHLGWFAFGMLMSAAPWMTQNRGNGWAMLCMTAMGAGGLWFAWQRLGVTGPLACKPTDSLCRIAEGVYQRPRIPATVAMHEQVGSLVAHAELPESKRAVAVLAAVRRRAVHGRRHQRGHADHPAHRRRGRARRRAAQARPRTRRHHRESDRSPAARPRSPAWPSAGPEPAGRRHEAAWAARAVDPEAPMRETRSCWTRLTTSCTWSTSSPEISVLSSTLPSPLSRR